MLLLFIPIAARCIVYIVFFVVLFLLWAKPVEIVDDYTEVDSYGHIIRVNGMPFAEYLEVAYFLVINRIEKRSRYS